MNTTIVRRLYCYLAAFIGLQVFAAGADVNFVPI